MENVFLEGVEILYYNDYYDYPKEGLCIHKGIYYYYILTKEMEPLNDPFEENVNIPYEWSDPEYALYELTLRELASELYWHSLFCSNIRSYKDADKMLIFEHLKTDENFWNKKDKQKELIDFNCKPIIGYFKNIKYFKNGN